MALPDRPNVPRRMRPDRFSTWSLTTLRPPAHRGYRRGDQPRDAAPDPARRRWLLADHDDVEASPDPDFMPKMRRIVELYDHPPADGRVVCVDEFGPLNLLPRKGKV